VLRDGGEVIGIPTKEGAVQPWTGGNHGPWGTEDRAALLKTRPLPILTVTIVVAAIRSRRRVSARRGRGARSGVGRSTTSAGAIVSVMTPLMPPF
jgi:hypothetical protein